MKNVDLLLINPPFHTRNGSGSFFPLGLGYIISSVIAHEYTWDVINCTNMIHSFFLDELNRFEEALLVELQKYSPVMIGIGPCITSQLRALKIISHCCQKIFPSIPVVAGGPLASINGQEWLFHEDLAIKYIIKGDGEQAIPNAINAIKKTGNVANSLMISKQGYTCINEVNEINSILFPYRGLQNEDTFSTRRSSSITYQKQAAMITSRGCPYSCNYCVSGNLHKNVRKRSTSNIIQEMEDLYINYGINDVIFYDDCFFFNAKSVNTDIKIFSEALLEKDLHMTWQMELRPDLFLSLNEESIYNLNKCGCRQINLGIEKVSASGLEFLGKTTSIIGLREKILKIKNMSSICLSGTFILGGGEETRDDVIELIKESIYLGLDFAHYNPLFIYPGTPLYHKVFDDEKIWAQIIYNDRLPWGEIVYENANLKCVDLLNLVDFAYHEFYKNTKYADQQMIADRFNIKHGGNIIEDI